MNGTERYILNAIKTAVWSGFYSTEDVTQLIDDLLEGEADEAMLRSAVGPEFARKKAEESKWPDTTDCDRLNNAFAALDASGIIALQNAGYTFSEGLGDVFEALRVRGRRNVRGYCFYHGQDLERAVTGGGVMLAYGSLDDDKEHKTEVGRQVKAALEDHGFTVEWNGDPEARLNLPGVDWKRRGIA